MLIRKLNIDQINILLMVLSAGLAYAIPFELVLISYAFLGPAHYLTEISWLHDREYFTGTKWIWAPLIFLVTAMLLTGKFYQDNVVVVYFILCIAFCMSAAFALTKNTLKRFILFLLFMGFFIALRLAFPDFELAWAMLLPTVIHIFIFTGLFIFLGALKSRNIWSILSFLIFVICGLSYIFIVPSITMISSDFVDNNLGYFDNLVDYIANVASFNGLVNGHSVLAFLSFAYTYHYLNWFSKTEIIKWHVIPRKRFIAMVGIYIIFICILLIDFKVGLVALTFLSLAHVVLEFPLNALSIRDIGRNLGKSRN